MFFINLQCDKSFVVVEKWYRCKADISYLAMNKYKKNKIKKISYQLFSLKYIKDYSVKVVKESLSQMLLWGMLWQSFNYKRLCRKVPMEKSTKKKVLRADLEKIKKLCMLIWTNKETEVEEVYGMFICNFKGNLTFRKLTTEDKGMQYRAILWKKSYWYKKYRPKSFY